MFKFFDVRGEHSSIPSVRLRVETPLGAVGFEARVGSHVVPMEDAQHVTKLAAGFAAKWDYDDIELECVLCKPSLELPLGLQVTDCWAVMWRAQVRSEVQLLQFRCFWEANHLWDSFAPDSGKCLDAQSWDNEAWIVTIGTEDEEALFDRASRDNWYSKRLSEELRARNDWAQYERTGFTVHVPALQGNEQCQHHFVIAWGPYDEDSAATWYAVQQEPEVILAAIA